MARRRTMGSRDHILTYETTEPNQEILILYGGETYNSSPTYFNDSPVEYIEDLETGEAIPLQHTYPEVNPEGYPNAGFVKKTGIYRTYAEAGEHKIKLRWKQKSTSISNVFRNTSVKIIPYNLLYDLPNLLSASLLFYACYKLNNLSDLLFAKNKKLTDVSGCFQKCKNLNTVLNNNLFKECTELTNVASVFSGCSLLQGYIPSEFFKHNTKINNVDGIFQGCSNITGIADDIFAYFPNITRVEYAFYGCSNLINVDVKRIIEPLTKVTSLNYLFYGCTQLVYDIPDNLFEGLGLLKNINNMFYNCQKITFNITNTKIFSHTPNLKSCIMSFYNVKGLIGTIPQDLFTYTNNLNNISGLFNGTSVSGEIPAGLLDNLAELISVGDYNGAGLFQNCSNITGPIPVDFFKNNTKLQKAAGCFSRSKITTIPQNIFQYNRSLTNISSCFSGCSNATCSVNPKELISGLKLTGISSLFYKCVSYEITSLEDLFTDCPDVTDVSGMFAGCKRLNCTIPQDLFAPLTKLTSIWGFFVESSIQGNIPRELLKNNTQLSVFDNGYGAFMFYGCSNITGVIPGDLFAYVTKPVTSLGNLFRECIGIEGVEEGLFDNLTELKNAINHFNGCVKLKNIPNNLYAKNKKITNFLNTFGSCTSLTGTVPVDDDGTPIYNRSGEGKEGYAIVTIPTNQEGIPTTNHCFYNCKGLSDYDQIPDTWK